MDTYQSNVYNNAAINYIIRDADKIMMTTMVVGSQSLWLEIPDMVSVNSFSGKTSGVGMRS